MVKLSIVIPAYNEEKKIERTLNEYILFLNNNYKEEYEIIVVPNNCNDRTFEVAKKVAKKHKQIKIKNIPYYVGKSGALIEGFKLANGELVGFTDADNSAPPESFFKLVGAMNNFDGAIGSRWVKGADIEIKQPLSRRFFSRGFNYLVRFFLGLKYYDTQCGSKVFKGESLKRILPYLGKTRWAFDMDLLYRLKMINAKIREVPIRWRDDPRTSLNLKKAPIQMFLALVRLKLQYSKFKFLVDAYDKLPEELKLV